MHWTKADLKRIENAISGGAISMTGGINPAMRVKLMKEDPLQCAMFGLGEIVGVSRVYVQKSRSMIDWLQNPAGARVYPSHVSRASMIERERETIKKFETRIRILTRLKNKIAEHGLP